MRAQRRTMKKTFTLESKTFTFDQTFKLFEVIFAQRFCFFFFSNWIGQFEFENLKSKSNSKTTD